jgi:hypothetical protein
MKTDFPTASVGSSQAPTAAVEKSQSASNTEIQTLPRRQLCREPNGLAMQVLPRRAVHPTLSASQNRPTAAIASDRGLTGAWAECSTWQPRQRRCERQHDQRLTRLDAEIEAERRAVATGFYAATSLRIEGPL